MWLVKNGGGNTSGFGKLVSETASRWRGREVTARRLTCAVSARAPRHEAAAGWLTRTPASGRFGVNLYLVLDTTDTDTPLMTGVD